MEKFLYYRASVLRMNYKACSSAIGKWTRYFVCFQRSDVFFTWVVCPANVSPRASRSIVSLSASVFFESFAIWFESSQGYGNIVFVWRCVIAHLATVLLIFFLTRLPDWWCDVFLKRLDTVVFVLIFVSEITWLLCSKMMVSKISSRKELGCLPRYRDWVFVTRSDFSVSIIRV